LPAPRYTVVAVLASLPAGTLVASAPPAPPSGTGGMLDPLAGPPPASATTLDCGAVSSSILGRSVDYCVALPADYNSSAPARYPALYYLHGLFENERSWSERGGQEVLDGLVKGAEVGKFLVVLPDGGKTFYVNSYDGRDRYEDFFIRE